MSVLRSKGLQFLAKREHSRSELRQKLAIHAEDLASNDLDTLLDDFQARGWLSDRRFAEQWVNGRMARFGTNRLRAELRQKGVVEEEITHALEESSKDELERAQAVWRKKYSSPPRDMNEQAKQLRYLAARGFSIDIIYRVVGGENPGME